MDEYIIKSLQDILTAIEDVEQFIEGSKRYEEFLKNKMMRRAVEREIEIIGEATNRILKTDANFEIGSARSIVDARNRVIHGYDKVDNVIIWAIVINYLPKLKEEIEELLNN